MSFRCYSCDEAQPTGTRPTLFVGTNREVTYVKVENPKDEKDTRPLVERRVIGIFYGREAVKTVRLCPACATCASIHWEKNAPTTIMTSKVVHFSDR